MSDCEYYFMQVSLKYCSEVGDGDSAEAVGPWG
jgi:hypothetical protein